MAHVNRTELEGNLVADSELKYTATGTPLLTFSIANNQYQGKGKEDYTSFFNCVIWGKFAERMAPKIIKGCSVLFSCSLKMESFQDKTGVKRSVLKCVIGIGDFIRFTYRSPEAMARHNALAAQQQAPQQPAFGAQPQQPAFGAQPVVTAYSAPQASTPPAPAQPPAKPPTPGEQQVADLFGGDFQDDIPF
jgi:single-strand DNA-binding protein